MSCQRPVSPGGKTGAQNASAVLGLMADGGRSLSEVDPAALGAAVRQVLGDSLGYLYPAALRVAVRVGVADHLAGGPLPVQRLAARGGVQEDDLRGGLRVLAIPGGVPGG